MTLHLPSVYFFASIPFQFTKDAKNKDACFQWKIFYRLIWIYSHVNIFPFITFYDSLVFGVSPRQNVLTIAATVWKCPWKCSHSPTHGRISSSLLYSIPIWLLLYHFPCVRDLDVRNELYLNSSVCILLFHYVSDSWTPLTDELCMKSFGKQIGEMWRAHSHRHVG